MSDIRFLDKMDKKEVRESLGTNYHYKPEMNPQPVAAAGTSSSWWKNISKPTQPLQINRERQNSFSSETSTSPPVGSPQSYTDIDFTKFTRQNSKNIYRSFSLTE